MYKVSSLLGGVLVLICTQLGLAQNAGNLPYSQVMSVGEVNDNSGNIRNFGMGNLGVSTPNSFSVSFLNPALLIYNSRVTFEMAVDGRLTNIANAQKSQTVGTAGLGYLALALPITKGWRSAVGLRPYSAVSYGSYSQGTVQNDPNNTPVQTGYSGEGNISEVFFSNGFKIYKGLSLGVSGSYLFGVIDRSSYSIILDTEATQQPERLINNIQSNYNGLMFKGGLAYRQSLNKKVNLNLGGSYVLQHDLNVESHTVQERRDVNGTVIGDTNPVGDTISSKTALPGYMQLGLSFDNNKSWVAGVEYSARKWSEYSNETGQGGFADSYRVAVGGEYTPDAASFDSYLKRVSYRAGLSYAKTPVNLQGAQVSNAALHAGFSFPIGSTPRPPEYNQAALNIGLAFGKNGTTDNNLVRENYVRFNVGLALNSSWFIKPKID
ncbi:hypothetical protein AAE02nite_18940 [Adhaeribacter aerolatus]|uniref:Aromatic hydrocarbon degradation protein n=1 Tax=Adhaeribacter aerolatus TaxID=670289 RepID=A0A512AX26_9BACT|nr:hypothetical protein [Adhaeribacter aerolatus]GEO04230.1 hypothetical protein AAE02nite_18940 [Adhaeribacter aerolatus]